jgi:S1-C subfamily serine protease
MKAEHPNFEPDQAQLNQFEFDESKPAKSGDRAWRKPTLYLALLIFGGGIAVLGERLINTDSFAPAVPTPPLTSAPLSPAPATNPAASIDSNFITNVVSQVGPAVVRIDATRTVSNGVPDAFKDPFFRQFFGSDLPTPPAQKEVRGVGSGFIVSVNGEILTNAHVVAGVKTVTVTLKDGRNFKGTVMGSDLVTDVAVVKIDANNLPTAALGNSDQLKPGEWAIAIGNPLGLDNTVTTGIISATERSSGALGFSNERVNFLQTDAAINPGNSGGPLLNAQGQVIGMNTAIIQGAQGIGFAIPINKAKAIADQLIAKGKVEHPYLGIVMVTLTPEVKNTINNDPNSGLQIKETQGILITQVKPGSPADKAGIRAGDIITQVNNQPVKTGDEVQQAVEGKQVGSQLQIGLKRDGQSLNLGVKTGQLVPEVQQEQAADGG